MHLPNPVHVGRSSLTVLSAALSAGRSCSPRQYRTAQIAGLCTCCSQRSCKHRRGLSMHCQLAADKHHRQCFDTASGLLGRLQSCRLVFDPHCSIARRFGKHCWLHCLLPGGRKPCRHCRLQLAATGNSSGRHYSSGWFCSLCTQCKVQRARIHQMSCCCHPN